MFHTDTLAIICAYISGSIPFGLFFGYLYNAQDIRSIGSGNIGATNVWRTGKKQASILTFLCDMLKGLLPTWLALTYLSPSSALACAAASVIGHIFPIWLKFRGGKGIATTLGAYSVLFPITTCVMVGTWGVSFYLKRTSSISGIMAVFIGTLIISIQTFILHQTTIEEWYLSACIALLIVWTHRHNIYRLSKGCELTLKNDYPA